MLQLSQNSLGDTIGALFVGFSVSSVLYGMFLVQVYNYFRRYPLDKIGYKAIVLLLLSLLTIHQVFIAHAVYYYTITNYLNLVALFGKPIWSLVFQTLIGAVVGDLVKLLFTLRVWRFSGGNIWLLTFLMIVDICQLAVAIVFTLKCYTLPALPDLSTLRPWGVVALSLSVLNDMGIAIALCYYLQTMRCNYTQTNSLVRNLTIYAVNTGALTSAMSFSTLIIYNFMPETLVFVGCYFALNKLYAVSFVAALNTRQTIRGTDVEARKSASDMVTDQRSQRSGLLDIPLDAPPATRSSLNVESREGEESGLSAPTSKEDFVAYAT